MTLLGASGEVQREAGARGAGMNYVGDEEAVHAACEHAWGSLKTTALCDHLKRMK